MRPVSSTRAFQIAPIFSLIVDWHYNDFLREGNFLNGWARRARLNCVSLDSVQISNIARYLPNGHKNCFSFNTKKSVILSECCHSRASQIIAYELWEKKNHPVPVGTVISSAFWFSKSGSFDRMPDCSWTRCVGSVTFGSAEV